MVILLLQHLWTGSILALNQFQVLEISRNHCKWSGWFNFQKLRKVYSPKCTGWTIFWISQICCQTHTWMHFGKPVSSPTFLKSAYLFLRSFQNIQTNCSWTEYDKFMSCNFFCHCWLIYISNKSYLSYRLINFLLMLCMKMQKVIYSTLSHGSWYKYILFFSCYAMQ